MTEISFRRQREAVALNVRMNKAIIEDDYESAPKSVSFKAHGYCLRRSRSRQMPTYFSLHHDVNFRGYLRDEFSLAGTLVHGHVMVSRILQREIVKLGTEQAATFGFFFLLRSRSRIRTKLDDRKDGPLMNDDPQEGWSSFEKSKTRQGLHHLFRHITFYPGDNRCARFFADKALLVEELTIYERRLPGDKGMRTDAWTEGLPRMLPLLVSLRRAKFSGQMYLDAMHRVRTGVQGVLAQLTSITLDGVFFSNLAELASFFGCVPHLRRLAMNVVTVGGGDSGDEVYQGGLCNELETLKVGTGNLRPRWMRFLFGRDGVISLENLRELVFPVTSEVDSWMPGVHELVGRAPRLESAMLLDWRGSHQNLDHITPVPDIGHLRCLTVFIPLAYTDRYEVRRALIPKNTKVNMADTTITALDWTRRMLDTGPRLEKAVIIVNASSMVDGERVGEAWARLLRPNVMVRVEGDFSEMTRTCLGGVRVEPIEGRGRFYEL
ncbi:hypothetical protein IW261DRAFT_1424461 [Armillaria novae-zelandiae]|uniref:Uncharacterized protein n=1 Tax=Armillaria novae-zelandiae TaxID=153914 RepID=A0AA39NUR5_9AGAR|nr:hypothetical protein IW261DRAFT_1424461 [Armillaria novae-zelandiae]